MNACRASLLRPTCLEKRRAQHDLIEFTLLKAYIEASRLEDAQRLLDARRPAASGIPVMGFAAVH
jgi:hypothetical protein